ncbi:MAG: glycine/sarcosine/betaine reductase selenoprotein B family protein [Dehalococcoidia bacterium]|nr:glycine/sarcosine/betaine reductase selenoprotein B family protein [Dehalococcoidia bacterium]
MNINRRELEKKIKLWIDLEAQSDGPFEIVYEFINDREEKFARWIVMANAVHEKFQFSMNDEIAWHEFKKPLNESRISLLTTAGVRHKSDKPFITDCENTDSSHRMLSKNSSNKDFAIDHLHYDHRQADQDINCVFPIDALHVLHQEGVIGSVANHHFGLMGCISNTDLLIKKTIPEIMNTLVEDSVDCVVLTPG